MAEEREPLAFQIFPEEIWRDFIFARLEDLTDKINLMNVFRDLKASDEWQALKVGWLFEKVIAIDQFRPSQEDYSTENEGKAYEILHMKNKKIHQALMEHLKSLRQLKPWHYSVEMELPKSIKGWTSSVNPFEFERRDQRTGWFEDGPRDKSTYRRYWAILEGDVYLEDMYRVFQWWEEHEQHPSEYNPFPVNSLNVMMCDELMSTYELSKEEAARVRESNEHYSFRNGLQVLQGIVNKFGAHIFYLKINLNDFGSTMRSVLPLWIWICEALPCLPNLKELAFHGIYFGFQEVRDNLFVHEVPEVTIETLSLTGECNIIASELIQKLARRAKKLILDVAQLDETPMRLMFYEGTDTFEVRELVLLVPYGDEIRVLFKTVEEEFAGAKFPFLVKLTIEWTTYHPGFLVPLLRSFPSLVFLEVKEHLRLRKIRKIRLPPFEDEELLNRTNPSIRQISLPFKQGFQYDFIKDFPTIQEIQFNCQYKKPRIWHAKPNLYRSKVFPRLHEFIVTGEMHYSNIWSELPELFKIRVEWKDGRDFYRRDGAAF